MLARLSRPCRQQETRAPEQCLVCTTVLCLTSNVRFSCWTCSTLLPMVAVVTTGCPRCRRYSTEVFPALSNPTSTSLYSLLGLKRDQMLAVQLDQAWPMHRAAGLLRTACALHQAVRVPGTAWVCLR